MQFKVPQFIDIEDKVFGPLTFKQFAYLAGGAGFGYLAFRILPIYFSIFLGPAFIGFGLALAFMKYNDKPFIQVVESFIKFYTRSRLYLWHKQIPVVQKQSKSSMFPSDDEIKNMPHIQRDNNRGTMSGSNLSTLSWSLDVIGSKK